MLLVQQHDKNARLFTHRSTKLEIWRYDINVEMKDVQDPDLLKSVIIHEGHYCTIGRAHV